MAFSKTTSNFRWWEQEDGSPSKAEGIFSLVAYLDNKQQTRKQNNMINARLYGNQPASIYDYGYSSSDYFAFGIPENRISYNAVAMTVDTLVSKIGKNNPKVTFLTSEGDWTAQNTAKKLEKFVMGDFQQNKMHQLGKQVFKDCCIEDLGVAKHFIQGNRVISERCWPNEIYVDEVDARYGEPTHMYHAKYVSRRLLKAEYPDKEMNIETANQSLGTKGGLPDAPADEFVIVIESWKLPELDDNGKYVNGKHSISLSNCVLFEEEWEHNWFPFSFMRWNTRLLGFYGQSLSEELTPLQLEVNKLMRDIQTSYNYLLAPKMFLPNGSKIPEHHLDNEIGTIIKGSVKPEIIGNGQIFPSEAYAHLRFLIESMFERAGLTQLSATGKKPGGLDAAVAMREYQDIESERFAAVQQAYEQWYVDTATIRLELSKRLKSPVVKFEGKRSIEKLDLREVDLEDLAYVMKVMPTNMLPETPAGQLMMLKELQAMGLVDTAGSSALLDFPDVNGFLSTKNAAWNYFHKLISKMAYEGEMDPPDPSMPLELGLQMVQQHYDLYKLQGAPEENLQLFRTWLSQARAILGKAAAQAQAAQMPMPQPGEGAGQAPMPEMAPQQSAPAGLLPQIPQG